MKPRTTKRKKKRANHRTATGVGDQEFFWWHGAGMSYGKPYIESKYVTKTAQELGIQVSRDITELLARAALKEEGYKLERETAIKWLVGLSRHIAFYLENLTTIQPEVMREIAAREHLWPVNLGLKKDKTGTANIQRVKAVRDYVVGLGLGSRPRRIEREWSGMIDETPFRTAAIGLLNQLADWKWRWHAGGCNVSSPWLLQLAALELPMTRSNALDWWSVAQPYLRERWDEAPQEFAPLVKHLNLKLSAKNPYPSKLRTRVIDNDLKDAFLGLAVADL